MSTMIRHSKPMTSGAFSVVLLLFIASVSCAQPILKDIPYGTLPGQKLDVYLSEQGNSPIVILIHGGAWFGGNKGDMAELAVLLQRRGYTVASINYRLSWQATFPANIEDVSCAVAFMRVNAAEYRGDPSHIALLGYSAGGHLAMLQATAGSSYLQCVPEIELRLDAVIGIAGIYSFRHREPGEPDRLLQMLGDSARYWDEADPIKHLDGLGDTKFLLLTDVAEQIVRSVNSYELFDSLQNRGKQVELRVFPTRDHLTLLSQINEDDTVIATITEYLDSLWKPSLGIHDDLDADTVAYDVDLYFQGRSVTVYSRYEAKVLIYDLLGRLITRFDVSEGVSKHYLWNVPYGCYFVSVIANKSRTTVRVILE